MTLRCFMFVGVPGSGKSTYVNTLAADRGAWTAIRIYTDDIVEQIAQMTYSTYSDVWKDSIDFATTIMMKRLQYVIKYDVDIIWDQTNTGAKSRQKKLANLPEKYEKIAVVFESPPEDILKERLTGPDRVGKIVPYEHIQRMISTLEPPTLEEGFDEIVNIKAF